MAMHLKGSIYPFIKSVSIQEFQGLEAVRSMIQVGTVLVGQKTLMSYTLGNGYWLWKYDYGTARNIEVYHCRE